MQIRRESEARRGESHRGVSYDRYGAAGSLKPPWTRWRDNSPCTRNRIEDEWSLSITERIDEPASTRANNFFIEPVICWPRPDARDRRRDWQIRGERTKGRTRPFRRP